MHRFRTPESCNDGSDVTPIEQAFLVLFKYICEVELSGFLSNLVHLDLF
jgi:hypothetical protein